MKRLLIVAFALLLAAAPAAQHYQSDFTARRIPRALESRLRSHWRRGGRRRAGRADDERLHPAAPAQLVLLPVGHRDARQLPRARRTHEAGRRCICRRATPRSSPPKAKCCRPTTPSWSRSSSASTTSQSTAVDDAGQLARQYATGGRGAGGGGGRGAGAPRVQAIYAEFEPAEGYAQSRGELRTARSLDPQRSVRRPLRASAAVRRAADRPRAGDCAISIRSSTSCAASRARARSRSSAKRRSWPASA